MENEGLKVHLSATSFKTQWWAPRAVALLLKCLPVVIIFQLYTFPASDFDTEEY